MFAALGDNATRGFVEARVSKFIALGPIISLVNMTIPFIQAISNNELLYQLVMASGVQELVAADFLTTVLGRAMCTIVPALCNDLLSFVADANP
jgi:hypothetical protein